jgi:hypothetical protein
VKSLSQNQFPSPWEEGELKEGLDSFQKLIPLLGRRRVKGSLGLFPKTNSPLLEKRKGKVREAAPLLKTPPLLFKEVKLTG